MEKSLTPTPVSYITEYFGLKRADVRTYSPLALAHIGDAVYEQIVRTIVISKGNVSPNRLHKITVKYVNAKTQAQLIEAIMDQLTEEEQNQYRRGKNSSPGHNSKYAGLSDYLKATGFEALVGYLYLNDDYERILEICKKGFDRLGILG